jgi:tRNA(Arg) A34 adenosine deaminase TadA
MIPASYKPRKKFIELAVLEAKRPGDRGDYPIGAVITRLMGRREEVITSAGNRATTHKMVAHARGPVLTVRG